MTIATDSLFIIFGQQALNGSPEYFCYLLFDDQGQVERENLELTFKEFSDSPIHPYYLGPFTDVDTLSRFAFKVCLERGKDRVRLISHEEYNQVLESCNDRQALITGLEKVGQSLENLEAPKKGLLGKIFR